MFVFGFKKKKKFDQRPWTTSENQRGPKTRQNSGPLSLWSHLKRKNKPNINPKKKKKNLKPSPNILLKKTKSPKYTNYLNTPLKPYNDRQAVPFAFPCYKDHTRKHKTHRTKTSKNLLLLLLLLQWRPQNL